jgi:sugar/nucleoside kinase (ribokinase family)
VKLKTNPTCIGTGLLALDVIVNGNPQTPPKYFAGGSCGNVLTILAFLGWDSFPIARLADNNASKEVISDLKKWNVNTGLITRKEDGSTPIIIHRILKDKEGKPKHRFEFRDPDTGAWLPRYKPVLSAGVQEITKSHPKATVYYFDRANRASIDMAKVNRENGALIFFEPSSNNEPRLFREAMQVCHIVKFSHERVSNYHELYPESQAILEIETLGKDGLNYRFSKTKKNAGWKKLKSFIIKEEDLVDAAGAGDWCSAGIIDLLGKNGAKTLLKAKNSEIEYALKYGQALGALNCCYNGARGLMYNLAIDEVKRFTTALITGKLKAPLCKSVSVKQETSKQNSKGKPKLLSSLY